MIFDALGGDFVAVAASAQSSGQRPKTRHDEPERESGAGEAVYEKVGGDHAAGEEEAEQVGAEIGPLRGVPRQTRFPGVSWAGHAVGAMVFFWRHAAES